MGEDITVPLLQGNGPNSFRIDSKVVMLNLPCWLVVFAKQYPNIDWNGVMKWAVKAYDDEIELAKSMPKALYPGNNNK